MYPRFAVLSVGMSLNEYNTEVIDGAEQGKLIEMICSRPSTKQARKKSPASAATLTREGVGRYAMLAMSINTIIL